MIYFFCRKLLVNHRMKRLRNALVSSFIYFDIWSKVVEGVVIPLFHLFVMKNLFDKYQIGWNSFIPWVWNYIWPLFLLQTIKTKTYDGSNNFCKEKSVTSYWSLFEIFWDFPLLSKKIVLHRALKVLFENIHLV